MKKQELEAQYDDLCYQHMSLEERYECLLDDLIASQERTQRFVTLGQQAVKLVERVLVYGDEKNTRQSLLQFLKTARGVL